MESSYPVTWQEGGDPLRHGKLELGTTALVLEGSDANGPQTRRIPYEELASAQLTHISTERLGGRPTLFLDRRSATPLRIAGVSQPGIMSELAENLATLRRTGERHMSRLVIVVPLREDARERARALLRIGPPFDPAAAGLERHHVFLTGSEAVFLFEAGEPDAVDRLASDPTLWEAVEGWSDLVAGPPHLAEDVYSWVRAPASQELSSAPTPGPGDSDGGDVFAP